MMKALSLFSLVSSVFATTVTVHLSPSPLLSQSQLDDGWSPRSEVSKYLGLDAYESAPAGLVMQAEAFIGINAATTIGAGSDGNVLLLSGDEGLLKGLLPKSSTRQTFPLSLPANMANVDALQATYAQRAAEVYPSVLSAVPKDNIIPANTFVSINVDSAQVAEAVKSMIEENSGSKVVILASSSNEGPKNPSRKRSAQTSQAPFPSPPAHAPILGVSTCHTSLDACNNGTNTCSGHGQCSLAQKGPNSCYVCSCGVSVAAAPYGNSNRTTRWAGAACERKDYSGDFTLLAGVTLTLLILVGASIALLTSVGQVELPSVLIAGGKSKND